MPDAFQPGVFMLGQDEHGPSVAIMGTRVESLLSFGAWSIVIPLPYPFLLGHPDFKPEHMLVGARVKSDPCI